MIPAAAQRLAPIPLPLMLCADRPILSWLFSTKAHNAYWGCPFCLGTSF
jgi:hypothetical protein